MSAEMVVQSHEDGEARAEDLEGARLVLAANGRHKLNAVKKADLVHSIVCDFIATKARKTPYWPQDAPIVKIEARWTRAFNTYYFDSWFTH